jgi:histidyl-tRNA synthetase
MAVQKPSIPKGTRDFGPQEMMRRNYIFDTIRSVFKTYGYLPIETPSMENLSTLMGKYGEEGDKLLFKILNSGNFLEKLSPSDEMWSDYKKMTAEISEKGLRYDLTVPFARFVVQHQNEISFPFKRYQIQPVWRADRPQKGRYREFFQCDVDVVGSSSLYYEAELVQILNDVFNKLGIRVVAKLSNRKILSGIAEIIGEADKIIDITVAIDKLDKIGIEKVNEELIEKGLTKDAVEKLQPILNLTGSNDEKLSKLENLFRGIEIGLSGIEELRAVFNYLKITPVETECELDLTLARGLNYYTGAIFEVKALDAAMGSISGGGRYDNLTGIFGLPGVSGVGISFGADRIYDVMNELNLFPEESQTGTRILFANFGETEMNYCLPVLQQLRKQNIPAEIYPEAAKMKKQMGYANDKMIPFVALAGENELKEGKFTLKNMTSGEQWLLTPEDLIEKVK